MKLTRLSDPQCVGPRLEFGKFIAPVGVAVDRCADRAFLGDQLHHDSFEQIALGGFHHAFRTAQQHAFVLSLRGQGSEAKCEGQDGHQDGAATMLDWKSHRYLPVSAHDSGGSVEGCLSSSNTSLADSPRGRSNPIRSTRICRRPSPGRRFGFSLSPCRQ